MAKRFGIDHGMTRNTQRHHGLEDIAAINRLFDDDGGHKEGVTTLEMQGTNGLNTGNTVNGADTAMDQKRASHHITVSDDDTLSDGIDGTESKDQEHTVSDGAQEVHELNPLVHPVHYVPSKVDVATACAQIMKRSMSSLEFDDENSVHSAAEMTESEQQQLILSPHSAHSSRLISSRLQLPGLTQKLPPIEHAATEPTLHGMASPGKYRGATLKRIMCEEAGNNLDINMVHYTLYLVLSKLCRHAVLF